jgi:ribosome-associated translation inhibitor RaiA
MKQLMRPLGISPLVIPNGLAAETLLPPARQAVAAFRTRLRGRTVVAKVARWDPDKRWLLAVATLAAMKRQGWRPLLIARGGIEAHGHEVLAAAAAVGLRVVERPLPRPGVPGLLQTLEGLEGVDVISLRSPLDGASCRVLFRGADAVLANSGHEPFGLVGLETMAAGGVACTGGSGEDYAVPGYNALVLETEDPQEFLGLFAALRAHPAQEHALRRAGRLTARQYRWPQVLQRALLPRLTLPDRLTLPGTVAARGCKEPGRMRMHIEGIKTPVPSYLLGRIAERLEALNMPSADISRAHVALVQHTDRLERRYEARVRLVVAGCLLRTRYCGPTPYEAASVALTRIERALRQRRAKAHTVRHQKGRTLDVSAAIPSLR